MVTNAEEGIREYDKRIAGFALREAGKGITIVANKWDTIKKDNHTVTIGKWISVSSSNFWAMHQLFFVSKKLNNV